MNYRNVYRALSVKNAVNVLLAIYQGCLTGKYQTFETLRENLRINKNTLRRITNRLSACGLINSTKDQRNTDKRKRIYVVADKKICEMISDLTKELMP